MKAWQHPHFLRDDPSRLKFILRVPVKGKTKASPYWSDKNNGNGDDNRSQLLCIIPTKPQATSVMPKKSTEVTDDSTDWSDGEAEFDRKVQLAIAPLEQHNTDMDSFNEAEFRRKAWLALAPLYEAPSSSSNSGEINMAGYQDTDTKIESERSAELDMMINAWKVDTCKKRDDDTGKCTSHIKTNRVILNKCESEANPYPTNNREEYKDLAVATGLTKTNDSRPSAMRRSTSNDQPISNYSLYYILERELFYKESGIKTEEEAISDLDLQFFGDIARSFPPRPSRYDSLELSSTWFIRKNYCRGNRSKMEGIALADLSNMIAASWKTCDREVKNYVNDVARILKQHYASVILCQEIGVRNYPSNSLNLDGGGVQHAATGIYNSVLSQSLSVSKSLFATVPDRLLREVQKQTIYNSDLLPKLQTQMNPFSLR